MKLILYIFVRGRTSQQMKLEGARRAARGLGYRLQPVETDERLCAHDAVLLDFWKPTGIIVDCGGLPVGAEAPRFGNRPTVYINLRTKRPCFSVCTDNRSVAERAARELLLLGYAHFAFVGTRGRLQWSELREGFFRQAIALNGKTCSTFARRVREEPIDRARRLNDWLLSLPKPCGLFAANDGVAKEVLEICVRARLRVPQDFGVIGVDADAEIGLNTQPTLSSVLPDMEKIGHEAMALLHARIRNPRKKPARCEIEGDLAVIHRGSTKDKTSCSDNTAKALALIRAQACDGLRARDVVAQLRGSRRYAELQFREATGRTILREIQSVRMERAKELLMTSRLPIASIAAQCGYLSVPAFYLQYRRTYGKLPRQNRSKGG